MPVRPWRSRVSAASANQRTKRILILLSILAFLVAVSGSTVAGYVNQRSEIAAMREQVREQQRRVAQLHADMLRWQDPAYVEQQARERLKFVRVGERSYTVIDAQPPRTVTEVSVDMAAPTSQLPWYACRVGKRSGRRCRGRRSRPGSVSLDDLDAAAVQRRNRSTGARGRRRGAPVPLWRPGRGPDPAPVAGRDPVPDHPFYATCPRLTGALSTLESSGLMREMTQRLADDPDWRAPMRRLTRTTWRAGPPLGEVAETAGVSAGGMPLRVKCLHVLVAHSLAAGPGVNPFGDEALELARAVVAQPVLHRHRCREPRGDLR